MTQYRIPVEEKFSFQRPTKDKDLNDPPVSPVKADRYIVGSAPTGAWATHASHIAWYDGSAWQFDTPSEGWLAWVEDENKFYKYITGWTALDAGDMYKSTYDTDADGIVDKAENVDDGAGNASSAANVKDAVDKKHTAGSEAQGGDISGTVGSATVDTVGGKTAAGIADAVDKKHTQGTDQFLDQGGASEISAANAKTAYDRRGQWDAELGCVLMNI